MRARKTIPMGLALAAGVAGLGWALAWGQATGSAGTAGAAAGTTGSAGAASAQQAPPDSGVATLQVFSRETVVDVTVTDSKGNPVRGLKQSDFTISEDGKPQPIRGFAEFGKDTPPADQRVPPKLPPNVYTNVQPPPASSSVNILLLDAVNTLPADQVYMKQESIKYLKSMPKGTRIAVFGLSNRLRILQGFTSDPAILLAAVDSKKNRALPSPFIDSDTGEMIDSLMDVVNDGTAASLAEFENEQATFQADIRNRMTLEALDQIAAYVSGIKGRKNLIWFCSGIPFNIFPTQLDTTTTGGTNDLQGMTDYTKDLRKTTDLLTSAEVAVYPVDARGLFTNPANSVTVQTKAITAKTGSQKAASEGAFLQKTGTEHLSMVAVAEATGGVAYFDTNDLKEAVTKAIENGANYYTLSYVPPDLKYDGRYHAIDVKVDQPNLHLEYRRGYNADDIAENQITPELTLATTAPEPYGNNMIASMGRGVPTASQILFSVLVEPSTGPPLPNQPPVIGTLDPKLKGKSLVRYDINYSFPARELTSAPGPDGARNIAAEFDLVAYDVFGNRITALSQSIKRTFTPEQYAQFAKGPFRVSQQLDMPPGETFLRVGVLDAVSDKVGTTEIPLTVHKPAANAAAVGAKGGN